MKMLSKSHKAITNDKNNQEKSSLTTEVAVDLLLEHNKLAPEVLDLVSLSKVATVQSILESKRVTGHVVCTPWATDSS